MASTLAGNLTITGSVADIIVVESARPDVDVSFLGLFPCRRPNHRGYAAGGMGMAGMD